MKNLVRFLGSLKLNIGLLLILVVVLGIGTIVESRQGTAAARAIYYAPWFRALLGLFALNVACSLWSLWPWGRFRIGFALTHGSMLVILLGAFVTDTFKIEGQLPLWEGEESSTFRSFGTDPEGSDLPLPFSVKLESFEIDHYPGTRRPAMFRSRVLVRDPETQDAFPAVIEMNRELKYKKYKFFQSSYQIVGDREMTVLSVSRDPGQWIVFLGYVLLVAGMIVVLTTRIVQRRAIAQAEAARAGGMSIGGPVAGLVAVVALALFSAVPVRAATAVDPTVGQMLRDLPIQHDGRTMPLDTLAREAVGKVTGSLAWNGADPVGLVASWTQHPAEWAAEPVVRLGGTDMASAIGLAPGTSHASFRDLAANSRFHDLLGRARVEEEAERKLTGILEDVVELEGRLLWLQGFLRGDSIRTIPVVGDPVARWSAPGSFDSPADLVAARDELRAAGVADYPSQREIRRELTYNAVRPSRLSWWILLPATFLSLGAWIRPERWITVVSALGLLAGFFVMTWGIWTRWLIAGRIPASNMYESMLFLGWGVALFALLASAFLNNRLVIFNATAMSALTMLLVDLLPIDPFIHPMQPVLSGTPWLAIHVPIIMVSYSVFTLGVLIAHMQIGFEIFAPKRRDLNERMNDLLYWYMQVGSILLVAGILTGSIWAASSWGRYWGWDPKEVWSLIAFLAYMAILHSRLDRIIGTFGIAAASIVAFWMILMTYIGVNFVLTAGLHSYGFGGSGVVRWMTLLVLVETFFISIGLVAHLKNRKAEGGLSA